MLYQANLNFLTRFLWELSKKKLGLHFRFIGFTFYIYFYSFCQSLSETDPGKSEGVSALPPRGILKRRRVQLVPGTRFRCYSESTASDQDWVARRLGSPGAKLVEEKGVPRSKTVRFSEKVHQQLYR